MRFLESYMPINKLYALQKMYISMIKRLYNPRHIDLYVALLALVALGAILGIGYGFMELEREYVNPCSIEPIITMDAITFFDEHKDMSDEQLQEKYSETKKHAVKLTGVISLIDRKGEYLHIAGQTNSPTNNVINCTLRQSLDTNIYKLGTNVTVQCYCKGKKELEVSNDPFASMMGGSSTEIVLYKCCVE